MDLHWLPVKFRIEFKILLIVFKIFRGLAPSYLSFLIISKPASKYNLRSSNDSTLLSYPNIKSKATLGERAFVFAALSYGMLCRDLSGNLLLLTLLRES